MQSEKTVEIDDLVAGNVDGWPHGVIVRFGVRHHNVKPIRGSPLENHHQALVADTERLRSIGGAREKSGNGSRTHNCHSAVAEKYSSCDGHKKPLLAACSWSWSSVFGPPRSWAARCRRVARPATGS